MKFVWKKIDKYTFRGRPEDDSGWNTNLRIDPIENNSKLITNITVCYFGQVDGNYQKFNIDEVKQAKQYCEEKAREQIIKSLKEDIKELRQEIKRKIYLLKQLISPLRLMENR